MSKIILINGACGIGKSTISKMLHQKIEYAILWEKDVQRRNVSQYKANSEHYKRSASIVLQMTHSMMECCANSGLDMVYDGVLIREEDILSLEKHATDLGMGFYHIYLNAPSNIWLNRLQERGFSGSLTEEKAIYFYEGLKKLKNEVSMYEIDTSINKPEEVVELICKHSLV